MILQYLYFQKKSFVIIIREVKKFLIASQSFCILDNSLMDRLRCLKMILNNIWCSFDSHNITILTYHHYQFTWLSRCMEWSCIQCQVRWMEWSSMSLHFLNTFKCIQLWCLTIRMLGSVVLRIRMNIFANMECISSFLHSTSSQIHFITTHHSHYYPIRITNIKSSS